MTSRAWAFIPILHFQLPLEAATYWLQHGLMLIVPFYLLRLGGVYTVEPIKTIQWNVLAYSLLVAYHFTVLQGVSLVSNQRWVEQAGWSRPRFSWPMSTWTISCVLWIRTRSKANCFERLSSSIKACSVPLSARLMCLRPVTSLLRLGRTGKVGPFRPQHNEHVIKFIFQIAINRNTLCTFCSTRLPKQTYNN